MLISYPAVPIRYFPSFLSHLIRRYVPWAVVDALVVIISLSLAWAGRDITAHLNFRSALPFAFVAFPLCLGINHLFGFYHRVWRYASAGEVVVVVAIVLPVSAS